MAQPRTDFYKILTSHQTNEFIQALKKDLSTINEPNSQGLTLLQLAAREGMITAVLWLLHSGAQTEKTTLVIGRDDILLIQQAQKTPLYLALERGHYLLAAILLAAGANPANVITKAAELKQPHINEALKQLKIEPELLGTLLYWALTHYDPVLTLPFVEKLLACFKPARHELKEEKKVDVKNDYVIHIQEAQNFGRHLELACHLKLAAVAERLHKEEGTTSSDQTMRTAGFWAAVNLDAKLHAQICKSDEDVVMTLRQLQTREAKLFEEYYSKSSAAQQLSLTDSEDTSPPPKTQLTARQNRIYNTAVFGTASETALLCKQDDDYLAVVQHAFLKKNYVTLKLLQTLRDQNVFLRTLLKKDQHLLAMFTLLSNDIDLYEFSLASRHDADVLGNMIKHRLTSPTGLFQSVISRGIKVAGLSPTREEKAFFTLIPNKETIMLDTFLRCLQDRFPDPNFTDLLASREVDLAKRVAAHPVRGYNAGLLVERFSRFGLALAFEQKAEAHQKMDITQVTPAIFNKFLQYLDAHEQKRIVRASRRFYLYQSRYQYALENKKEDSPEVLGTRLVLLDRLLKQIDLEIGQKGYCSGRSWKRRDSGLVVIALLMMGGFIFGVYWLTTRWIPEYDQIKEELATIPTKGGRSCASFIDATSRLCASISIRKGYDIPLPEICFDPCNILEGYQRRDFVGPLCAATIGGVGLLADMIYLCIRLLCCTFREGKERFDNFPVNQFTKATSDAALAVFTEYKNTDHFKDMDEKTTLGAVRAAATPLHHALKIKCDLLKAEEQKKDEQKEEKKSPARPHRPIGFLGSINGSSKVGYGSVAPLDADYHPDSPLLERQKIS